MLFRLCGGFFIFPVELGALLLLPHIPSLLLLFCSKLKEPKKKKKKKKKIKLPTKKSKSVTTLQKNQRLLSPQLQKRKPPRSILKRSKSASSASARGLRFGGVNEAVFDEEFSVSKSWISVNDYKLDTHKEIAQKKRASFLVLDEDTGLYNYIFSLCSLLFSRFSSPPSNNNNNNNNNKPKN